MLEDASDIFAAVAALKSLAGGVAPHIITPMSKPVKRHPRAVVVEAARRVDPAKIRDVDEGSYTVTAPPPGWRRPVPAAPPTDDWTKDDLRNWRDRLGLRSQAEAAALLRMGANGYAKLELGMRSIRPSLVLLARYIEAYGPLP